VGVGTGVMEILVLAVVLEMGKLVTGSVVFRFCETDVVVFDIPDTLFRERLEIIGIEMLAVVVD
jgi:hypothetical protein